MSDDEPSPLMGRIAGAMLALASGGFLLALLVLNVVVLILAGVDKTVASIFLTTILLGLFVLSPLSLGVLIARGEFRDIEWAIAVNAVLAVLLAAIDALLWRLPEVAFVIGGCAGYFIAATLLGIAGRPGYRAWRAGHYRRARGES